MFIECFKLLVSQKKNVCVRACVCACVRACVRACVCVRNYILPGFNMLLHKCYLMLRSIECFDFSVFSFKEFSLF